MKARISGLGKWLPEQVRDNSAWPPHFSQLSRTSADRELVDVDLQQCALADQIAHRHFALEARDPFFGTVQRRIAADDMDAPRAEAFAAKAALTDAGLDPMDLDVVFSAPAVPERIAPSSAPRVAKLLGAERAYAACLDAVCASPVIQLDSAAALIESGRARHVLLTQSNLMTRTMPLSHPASPNVGDVATAMVVSASEKCGVHLLHAVTHGQYYESVTWRSRGEDKPWWQGGADYYLGSLDKQGAQYLVRNTVSFGAATIKELMAKARLSPSDIDLLISVQPRRWIPGAIAEALQISVPAPQTFEAFAHLGGCGIVTNLLAAREKGLLRSECRSVLYSQGAGFTRAAALVTW